MADGYVLYEGLSRFDEKPIVVVATGFRKSWNTKTGPGMIQTWILPATESAAVAVREGRDTTVCGDCPLRSSKSGGMGACYVNIVFAPTVIYSHYRDGAYPALGLRTRQAEALFRNRKVRLGAYGDPAAVPIRIWRRIAALADGTVGYTHAHATCDPELCHYCMASVASNVDATLARKAGWRTFRILLPWENLEPGEFTCPASAEAGHRLTCETCMACWGADDKPRVSPAIRIHGAPNRSAHYVNLKAQLRLEV